MTKMKVSISKILQELNSPFLMKWANKIWLEWIKLDDYQKKSKKDWIDKHLEIENYIKEYWFKDYKTLFIEKDLLWEHFYWRCDFIAEKDWIHYIFDFKSNDKIYLSHILQLIWYKKLYWKDCKIWIINLNNKEEIILNFTKEQEEKYFVIFKCLYLIYKNKFELNQF